MDSTFLFLPEMILIASILAIPAIYIATESTKSYSICSNISLFVSLLLVVLFWYYPDDVSFDKSSSSYIIYDHFVINDFSQLFKAIFLISALAVSVVSSSYFKEDELDKFGAYIDRYDEFVGHNIIAVSYTHLTLPTTPYV